MIPKAVNCIIFMKKIRFAGFDSGKSLLHSAGAPCNEDAQDIK